MTKGTLTQAFTTLTWGGETLHAQQVGDFVENVAQEVSVNLNKGESAPTADFSITPNPAGMALFQKLKKESLDKPFVVTYGYLNSKSKAGPWSFRFAGLELTTGHQPRLRISGVSTVKGAWTDNKISYTMEQEMPLTAFPDFLKEKCGEGCKDMNFVWKGKAEQVAAEIMVKGNQVGRTPMTILTDVLRPHGIQVQVSDNAFQGEMVLSYSPIKEGELEIDKPTVNSGGVESKPATRTVFIIGPGLMTSITRTQKFNMGSSSTEFAASANSPNVAQTSQTNVPVPQSAGPQTSTAESSNTTGGTSGQDNPGSANTGSTKAPADDTDATVAVGQGITTEVSFSVLMVPYMVGIKPRDLIAIPSLKGPGDYIEDWEVTDVKYSMNNTGGVSISISGQRPYTGEQTLLDSASLESVKSTVKSLVTPAQWNKFYWIQGPDNDRPLAG